MVNVTSGPAVTFPNNRKGAAQYPALSASGTPLTLNSNRGSSPASPIPGHLNLYAAGFDATWEVDLFGGTRRAIEEARQNRLANLVD